MAMQLFGRNKTQAQPGGLPVARRGAQVVKPARGMWLSFKASASPELAGIPGRVTQIWPRFRSGEYLVTLEYPKDVRLGNAVLRQMEAFASELEPARPPAPMHLH